MKIIIDDKIPFITGVLEPFAQVEYLKSTDINAKSIKDVDALIIRTRTKCDGELLQNSSVKYIGSATIGTDHIDKEYCRKNNIVWDNAPGSNADSVKQYIASALFSYALKKRIDLKDKTIGIIGVGNVGKKVAQFCSTIGMKVLLNDPPRERIEGSEKFESLTTIAEQADIITFHTPLNRFGDDKTYHLVDSNFLSLLKNKPLLINSARGEIFNTNAVKQSLNQQIISDVIIDCWENEPEIDRDLLKSSLYGTPHIAGYSRDGKANATRHIIQSISQYFDFGIDNWNEINIEKPNDNMFEIDGDQRREYSIIADAVLSTYDIECDSDALKLHPDKFEYFRGNYPARREFNSYRLQCKNVQSETLEKLQQLGFNIQK